MLHTYLEIYASVGRLHKVVVAVLNHSRALGIFKF